MNRGTAALVLADGTTFEGEAIGAVPAMVASGEVVFNTVLSGYQEVITDPSYAGQVITFTYPHIGNYGATPVDDESRRPPVAASSSVTWRGAEQLAVRRGPRRVPRASQRARHHRRRHPSAHPPHPRGRGHALRLRHRRRDRVEGRRRRRAGHRRHRPGGHGHDRNRLHRRATAPAVSSPTTSASSGRSSATSASSPPSRSCPRRHRRRDVLDMAPDGVFLSNGPGDPAAVSYASRCHRRAPRPGADLRHLPRSPAARRRRSAPEPSSCRSAITAATTRCDASRPEPSRSPARTTTTPSTRHPLERGGHPRQPERRRRRGHPLPRRTRLQRAVPPRGRTRPPRRPLPVRRSSPI